MLIKILGLGLILAGGHRHRHATVGVQRRASPDPTPSSALRPSPAPTMEACRRSKMDKLQKILHGRSGVGAAARGRRRGWRRSHDIVAERTQKSTRLD